MSYATLKEMLVDAEQDGATRNFQIVCDQMGGQPHTFEEWKAAYDDRTENGDERDQQEADARVKEWQAVAEAGGLKWDDEVREICMGLKDPKECHPEWLARSVRNLRATANLYPNWKSGEFNGSTHDALRIANSANWLHTQTGYDDVLKVDGMTRDDARDWVGASR